VQNGNTKDPVLSAGSLRYNPIPRDLGLFAPVPGSGQVSWLQRSTPTAAFPGKCPVTGAKAPWRQAPLSQ